MTKYDKIIAIANDMAGEDVSANYPQTIANAIKAVTEQMAGEAVDNDGTIEDAIEKLAPNVSGGGGGGGLPAGIAAGTFPSTGGGQSGNVGSFVIPYEGDGYPIYLFIFEPGGIWDNAPAKHVYSHLIVKMHPDMAPTYTGTPGGADYGYMLSTFMGESSVSTFAGASTQELFKPYNRGAGYGTGYSPIGAAAIKDRLVVEYVVRKDSNNFIGFTEGRIYNYIAVYHESEPVG